MTTSAAGSPHAETVCSLRATALHPRLAKGAALCPSTAPTEHGHTRSAGLADQATWAPRRGTPTATRHCCTGRPVRSQ